MEGGVIVTDCNPVHPHPFPSSSLLPFSSPAERRACTHQLSSLSCSCAALRKHWGTEVGSSRCGRSFLLRPDSLFSPHVQVQISSTSGFSLFYCGSCNVCFRMKSDFMASKILEMSPFFPQNESWTCCLSDRSHHEMQRSLKNTRTSCIRTELKEWTQTRPLPHPTLQAFTSQILSIQSLPPPAKPWRQPPVTSPWGPIHHCPQWQQLCLMEAPALAQMENLCPPSPEEETVCAALTRYENTLRDAIREIHLDVNTFKLGIERRLEETAGLSAPLEQAVAQLQQENQHLRSQLEALTHQVELLSGITCDRSTLLNHTYSQNHKNGLDDIQENHEDIKEVIHGKSHGCTQSQAQLHVQTLGNQTQTFSSQQSATIPSSSSSKSPPTSSRGSSTVLSPGSSSGFSVTRFSSRAIFAVSTKTTVSTAGQFLLVCHTFCFFHIKLLNNKWINKISSVLTFTFAIYQAPYGLTERGFFFYLCHF